MVDNFERLLEDEERAEQFISALNAGRGQQLLQCEGVTQAAVPSTASLAEALVILTGNNQQSAPVIDETGKFQGAIDLDHIVTRLQGALQR